MGQRHHGPSMSRVLRPGAQPGPSACGVSRPDAGRDVFRHRGRGASRPGVRRGHRPTGPRGGQPISGLRDVPLNRRGRLITDSGPSADHRDPRPRPSGNGAGSNRGPCVSTSRRVETVRDHVRCPTAAPCHLHDGDSHKKVQNVRGDSSAKRSAGHRRRDQYRRTHEELPTRHIGTWHQ